MKEIIHISHSLYKTDYQTIDIFSDYKFTYHIVYIKRIWCRCKNNIRTRFTYHIVYIKPQLNI